MVNIYKYIHTYIYMCSVQVIFKLQMYQWLQILVEGIGIKAHNQKLNYAVCHHINKNKQTSEQGSTPVHERGPFGKLDTQNRKSYPQKYSPIIINIKIALLVISQVLIFSSTYSQK